MTKRGQRDQERERFWRGTLSAWRSSGQSVREFCERRDLTETAFYFWRKELQRRDGERHGRSPSPTSPAFVPVTVLATLTHAVEVRCPSGHVVTLPSCEVSLLRELFAALTPEPPC
jgi:transposase-like protein